MFAAIDIHLLVFLILVGFSLVVFYLNSRNSAKRVKNLFEQVKQAEKQAFSNTGDGRFVPPTPKRRSPDDGDKRERAPTKSFATGGAPLETATTSTASTASTASVNHLFKLYSDQISKYQEQTQSRAMSSFIFAIIAMFAGIIFVFWGGSYILAGKSWEATAAGSTIATIGGAVSAYITKTFLSIHRLSIQQLNRYFQQPVINDHIVMAQRLADNLTNDDSRQKAYEKIIDRVSLLIVQDAEPNQDPPAEA